MWEKFLEEKIFDYSSVVTAITRWRIKNKNIVFTNGCFDLIHLGHIKYLMQAANQGDQLIVGINSDDSVCRLKGEHRPINDEISRMHVIASLFCVSGIVLFKEDTPLELIRIIKPDILVKGGDYQPDEVVGADVVKSNGGEVKILDFIPGYSSTSIEQKIRNQTS